MLRIYLSLFYINSIERYIVNFLIAVRIMLMIVQINGILAVMIIMLIWPFMSTYVLYIESIRYRIVLNETLKKMCMLVIVMIVSIKSMTGYVLILMYIKRGLTGYVVCGIYTYVIVTNELWIMLVLIFVLNITILVAFRVLSLGVLPIAYVFLKRGCSALLLYTLIIMAIFVIVMN